MKNLIYILLIFTLFACAKDDDGFRIYKVKAHRHNSTHEPKLVFCKYSIDAWFKVDESWVFGEAGNSYPGCSKVFGISLGGHHSNSARLAYKGFGEMTVGLWAYTPEHPKGKWFPLDTVQVGGVYHCRIAYERGYWILRINNKEVSVKAGKKKDYGYMLFPYIGGTYTLNHTWYVHLKL